MGLNYKNDRPKIAELAAYGTPRPIKCEHKSFPQGVSNMKYEKSSHRNI